MPFFRDGTHERVLAGLACGALPVTSESRYLRETFEEGKELLYYQCGHWDLANAKINDYLAHEEKRKGVAARGREKVMQFYTWDHRVDQLLEELPPILQSMQ